MPEGLGTIIMLLALGYLLLLVELFIPGGIVGLMGALVVGYGCYLAFDLGFLWGAGAIAFSILVTLIGTRVFFRSRYGKRLVLDDPRTEDWSAQEEDLEDLVGLEGQSLTPLRPSGMADFDGRRVDVVTDSEFLEADVAVRVREVEGNRVIVEAIEDTGEDGVSSSTA